MDLFFAYNSQWRTNNEVRLKEMAARENVTIRLVLPDTQNNVTMEDLSRRFNKPVERLKIKIDEAREQFEQLANFSGQKGAKIEIYIYSLSPHYSVYRFNDTFICALYVKYPFHIPMISRQNQVF